MPTKIHGRAATTPAIRKKIQESTASITAIAKKYGINRHTVRKWKSRTSVEDRKCGPKAESTVLTKLEVAIIVIFRKNNLVSLDDCLNSLKKTIPHLTRSSLHRCLQRHGISRLPQQEQTKRKTKKFKKYAPGYVHVDITQIYTEEGKLYLFVGIDRTTKFCFVRLFKRQTSNNAILFLHEMQGHFPNKINKILTDNGLQFTQHKGKKENHIFTKTCRELGIEHRLTKPFHPWTNGQVERMNRTIKEATIKKFYYTNHKLLEAHLHAFINMYNYAQPLKTLKGLTPYKKICLYLQSEEGKYSKNDV